MIIRACENSFRSALFCFVSLFTLQLALISPANADKKSDLRSQILSLKKTIQKDQRRLSAAEQDLESLDKNIAQSSTRISKLRKEIRSERKELEKVRAEQSEVNQQRSEHDGQLANHIRSMYLIGRQPTIKIVLNQESPASVGRMLKYYEFLNKAYMQEITLLSRQQIKLESMSLRLAKHTQRLSDLLEEHQKKRRDYEQQREKRRGLVAKLKRKAEGSQSTLSRLLADQKNLERLTEEMGDIVEREQISPSTGIGFAKMKGSLPWPIKGRLLARYGRSRLGSGQLNWRGLLIKADEGDEVANIADGTVVFSDWLRGYGYVVIVDHGSDYLSLYGHNQALFRDVGEKVKKGDILALVGQTGSSNIPALYFEIRHRGDPVNPQRWILARR